MQVDDRCVFKISVVADRVLPLFFASSEQVRAGQGKGQSQPREALTLRLRFFGGLQQFHLPRQRPAGIRPADHAFPELQLHSLGVRPDFARLIVIKRRVVLREK